MVERHPEEVSVPGSNPGSGTMHRYPSGLRGQPAKLLFRWFKSSPVLISKYRLTGKPQVSKTWTGSSSLSTCAIYGGYRIMVITSVCGTENLSSILSIHPNMPTWWNGIHGCLRNIFLNGVQVQVL